MGWGGGGGGRVALLRHSMFESKTLHALKKQPKHGRGTDNTILRKNGILKILKKSHKKYIQSEL